MIDALCHGYNCNDRETYRFEAGRLPDGPRAQSGGIAPRAG